MGTDLKARVFISCGQRKNSEEENIANKIKEELIKFGFDPYVAIKDQVSKGLKENIFHRLDNSEYLIFIDFKREKIGGRTWRRRYRGSLFANQELAIWSFIDDDDLKIIAFQEKGVKERDGILDVIQVNPIEFSSRADLAERVMRLVEEKIKNKEWDSKWRNELHVSREDGDYEEANYDNDPEKPTRFFHVRVQNRHISKVAWKCLSYVEKIYDCNKKNEIPIELIESKWRGIENIDIQIPPQTCRKFDGFFINKKKPELARLGFNRPIIDSSIYDQVMNLENPGDYKISYVVFSESFSPAKANFHLHLERNVNNIIFRKED